MIPTTKEVSKLIGRDLVLPIFGKKYFDDICLEIRKLDDTNARNVCNYSLTSLLMLLTSARSPAYVSYKARLKSFDSCRTVDQKTKEAFASAGFYFVEAADSEQSCGGVKCFFCNVSLPLSTDVKDIFVVHSKVSVKCFVFKLHRAVFNTSMFMSAMVEDIQRAKKAWTVVKPYLLDDILVKFTASFGFLEIIARIAIVRFFVFSNGQFPRSGEVIDVIHRDLEGYEEFLKTEKLLITADPLNLITDFLLAIGGEGASTFVDSSNIPSTSHNSSVTNGNRDTAIIVPRRSLSKVSEDDEEAEEKGYCSHSSEQKESSSKAMVMVPCLHLIRCSVCLSSDDLNVKLLCPKCGGNVLGGIACYLS